MNVTCPAQGVIRNDDMDRCDPNAKLERRTMLTRRHFIVTSGALFSAPLAGMAQTAPVSNPSNWSRWDAQVTPANYDPLTSNPWGFHHRFLPQVVEANPGLTPGDVHVDAVARYLYHIRPDGMATRYGVAIARGSLYEPGTYNIRRKAKWPTWRPTDAMIEREPEKYAQYEDGMDGGPRNPLGSRALYLYVGNRDTYLRIHGTPSPRSIGSRASSGCVRMVMAHIIGLYDQVEKGSTAFLYATEDGVTASS